MLHKELRAVIWFQPKPLRIGATNWNSAESSFCGTGPDRTLAKHSSKDIGTDYHMHPQASPYRKGWSDADDVSGCCDLSWAVLVA